MAEVNLTLAIRVSDEFTALLEDLSRLVELFPDEIPRFKTEFKQYADMAVLEAKTGDDGERFFFIVPDPKFASFVEALKEREALL